VEREPYTLASSRILQSLFGAGRPKLSPKGPTAAPKLKLSAHVPLLAIPGAMTVEPYPCHHALRLPVEIALTTVAPPPVAEPPNPIPPTPPRPMATLRLTLANLTEDDDDAAAEAEADAAAPAMFVLPPHRASPAIAAVDTAPATTAAISVNRRFLTFLPHSGEIAAAGSVRAWPTRCNSDSDIAAHPYRYTYCHNGSYENYQVSDKWVICDR
jgi:hypothetical protein